MKCEEIYKSWQRCLQATQGSFQHDNCFKLYMEYRRCLR